MIWKSHLVVLVLLLVSAEPATDQDELHLDGQLIELNEENWQEMLQGEWMIVFVAPWCQACKDLAVTWELFAQMATDDPVKVAKVDVTTAPSLSGRFYVTAVPTIFHVKDAEFRQYRGAVYDAALFNYVKKELWKGTPPLSNWMKPNAINMSIMGFFAKLSHTLKDIKAYLEEQFGLSDGGSYVVMAIGTVFLGATLGSLLVWIRDFVTGPIPMDRECQGFSELEEKLFKDLENLDTEDYDYYAIAEEQQEQIFDEEEYVEIAECIEAAEEFVEALEPELNGDYNPKLAKFFRNFATETPEDIEKARMRKLRRRSI
ncbi:thioredoxin-related transmembrane protein 1-like [Drosophila serrata]|uniref:thioredoxin-related transmembrane protein 1-like n=1 Tax=Drosophila serrata TaxID=7274 RepID=UPI000A1D2145|nr:thioredoxin-related transmembrane protein 1-like [Drosophila serrata]